MSPYIVLQNETLSLLRLKDTFFWLFHIWKPPYTPSINLLVLTLPLDTLLKSSDAMT